jgi:RND family efflux transporter MFP subunit
MKTTTISAPRLSMFGASAFGALAMLSLLSSCSEPPPAEKTLRLVRALQVAASDGLARRAFPGQAQAAQEANLSFRVSGQLQERLVDVGDTVESGAVLARLDPADFRNAMGAAQGVLDQAEAVLAKANADYERATNVQREDAGAISQRAVDRNLAARDAARAATSAARSGFNIAQDRLGYATLTAPFSGEVVATYVEGFETIVAKEPIVRLLDRSGIEFVIDVPEASISYADYITSAVVRFDARSDVEVVARVKEIAREARGSTRTFPVTLAMDQPDGFDILPGMAGSAVVSARLPDASPLTGITVPAAALFSSGDPTKSYVWVVADDVLAKREVSVSLPGDFGVLVQSGLEPGEWIVTAGVNMLSDGEAVRMMDATEDASGS